MSDRVRSRSSQYEKLNKSPSVQQAGVKVPLLFDTMDLNQEVCVRRRPSHADAHLKAWHVFEERKISGRGSEDEKKRLLLTKTSGGESEFEGGIT